MTIDIQTDSGLYIVAPGFMLPEDRMTDFAGARELVVQRPDFGHAMGRFVQGGVGDISSANQNGRVFVAEELSDAHKYIKNTPLNMLHQRNHVIGTFLGSDFIDPQAVADSWKNLHDKVMPDNKMPFPFVDALAAIWKFHFPDEHKAIQRAHDMGALFFSMEAVSDSLTCLAPGCPCDGATYPYRGVTDTTYCEALNTSRSPHRLNKPHFVGGAMVIPPALPGWKNADITKLGNVVDSHFEAAEQVYDQVAADAPHLDAAQWEFIMAMLLAGAFDEDVERPTIESFDIDRLISKLLDEVPLNVDPDDLVPPDLAGYRKATDPEVSCGTCDHFNEESKSCDLVAGLIEPAMVCDMWSPDEPNVDRIAASSQAARDADLGVLVAAGLAVVASDTGRVLMLQRAIDPTDPASGMWEFPGGKLEPGEDPFDAAKREWSEEIGQDLPDGQLAGTWTSPNGVYQGFVWVIAGEGDVPLNPDAENRGVMNPDDPDGDLVEVAAWFDPEHLPEMPCLRAECQGTDWEVLNSAVSGDTFLDATPHERRAEGMAMLGGKGQAFKNANGDWSYPTPDLNHLGRATQAWGRSKPADRPKLKTYLVRRAKALKADAALLERIKNLKP